MKSESSPRLFTFKYILPPAPLSLIPIILALVLVAVLWPTSQASAQCGSQASSCKNCHEVQGQDPVNSDGTGWHQSHAFGDFCYLCHAGNSQSLDQDESHTGMVPPLSDVEAGCRSCHPNDLIEKAEVYAIALGVEVGAGGGSTPPDEQVDAGDEPSVADPGEAGSPAILIADDLVLDYNAQYSETVLGQTPINWGNWIVFGMIGLIGLGGGAFVYRNERKLRGIATEDEGRTPLRRTQGVNTVDGGTRTIDGRRTIAKLSPVDIHDFPPEIVELLPKLNQLDPIGLRALGRLLEYPQVANDLLQSMSRLDPELIRRFRNLDRDTQALLIALAGN